MPHVTSGHDATLNLRCRLACTRALFSDARVARCCECVLHLARITSFVARLAGYLRDVPGVARQKWEGAPVGLSRATIMRILFAVVGGFALAFVWSLCRPQHANALPIAAPGVSVPIALPAPVPTP